MKNKWVDSPIANSESVLTFMRFKGWELEEQMKNFYILTPPKEIKPQSIRLKIPYGKDVDAYKVMLAEIVREIADLYDWHYFTLLHLLSNSPKEIDQKLQQILLLENPPKAAGSS